jgi:hypothetical protein
VLWLQFAQPQQSHLSEGAAEMRKMANYIVIGLLLLWVAPMLNVAGDEARRYAEQPYWPLNDGEVSRVPRNVRDWFGMPKEKAFTDFVYKSYMRRALNLYDLAFCCIWMGRAFITVGIASITCQLVPRVMSWLLVPDWLKSICARALHWAAISVRTKLVLQLQKYVMTRQEAP